MFPKDKLIVQATISRNHRDELTEIIQKYPHLFSEVRVFLDDFREMSSGASTTG